MVKCMRLLLIWALPVLFCGCGETALKPGTRCRVTFKPSALGVDVSAGLDTGSVNGQQVAWPGRFVKLTEDWLVISRDENTGVGEGKET